jgi:hypothetical protein
MGPCPRPGEPLSPQAADLIRRIARVVLDEPAGLMAEVHAAVLAAASRGRCGAGSGLAGPASGMDSPYCPNAWLLPNDTRKPSP